MKTCIVSTIFINTERSKGALLRVCVCVCASLPFKQHEEDILLGAQVLHRRRPSANLTPEDVVEDLRHIFLTLVDKSHR